jgi:hypothetical protein
MNSSKLKNEPPYGYKDMGTENSAQNPLTGGTYMKRLQWIDALTSPFRWAAGYLIYWMCPEFLFQVMDDCPLIARQVVELAMDDVGLEATGGEFKAALEKRMDNHRPEERKLLLTYVLVNGFTAREELWEGEFYSALNRRMS